MTTRSQTKTGGVAGWRLPTASIIALLAAVTTQVPVETHAQQVTALYGSWVVQRAGDDELAFRLDLSGEGEAARLEVFKRMSYWPVVAAATNVSAGSVSVVSAQPAGPWRMDLELGDWHAELISQSETTAIFRSPDDSQIGIAHRLISVDPDLLGEWERAELTPAGPRVRRLTVEEGRVVFYDRLGRSEAVAASGVAALERATSGTAQALALLPERQSGALVWLYPVGTGFIALEAGDDEFQVVYRPGEAPAWLLDQPEDAQLEQHVGDRPTGRWMVGSGDRSRQTHILDFTSETASISRVGGSPGDDQAEPVRVFTGSSTNHWRVAIGTNEPPERRHVLLIDDDRGVMWRDDDNRYQSLRRIVETPIALSGEWRVERVQGGFVDHVTIVGGTLRVSAQDEVMAVFASNAAEAALELTIVSGGRRGLLLRLWSLGNGTFVSDDGDRWIRPGDQN